MLPYAAGWRRRLTPALALIAIFAGCAREEPIEKTLLATLPANHRPRTIVTSANGEAWAFLVQTADGEQVVASSGRGEVHVKCTGLAFAPKSERLFYWTRDGAPEQPIIAIAADGASLATDFVGAGELSFSADGSRWTAIGAAAGAAKGELGEITLFVDGTKLVRHREVSRPAFSADAQHVAYLTATDGRATLFVDGNERRSFDPPTEGCGAAALRSATHPDLDRHLVRFLADGSVLVATRDRDGWGVYVDERRIASYAVANLDHADQDCTKMATLAIRSLRTAEHAPAAFWWERIAGDAELWRVVRNGRPVDDVTCVEPWRTHPPEPSSDGTRVIYPCRMRPSGDEQVVFLLKDRVRYGPYDNVWGLAPSEDGAHVAYGASIPGKDPPWGFYVDGVLRVEGFTGTWRPRLSEDGKTLAWEGMRNDDGRGVFGIDDRQLGSFDEVLWGPEFQAGDRVAWVIRRGRKITRISVPLSIARGPRRPHTIVRR